MALYEYFCDGCQLKFEQITSSTDPDQGKCPKCHAKSKNKLFSRFAIAGQGDLRESTMHGCHDCEVSLPGESPASGSHEGSGHHHSHSHDHSGHGHGSDES